MGWLLDLQFHWMEQLMKMQESKIVLVMCAGNSNISATRQHNVQCLQGSHCDILGMHMGHKKEKPQKPRRTPS